MFVPPSNLSPNDRDPVISAFSVEREQSPFDPASRQRDGLHNHPHSQSYECQPVHPRTGSCSVHHVSNPELVVRPQKRMSDEQCNAGVFFRVSANSSKNAMDNGEKTSNFSCMALKGLVTRKACTPQFRRWQSLVSDTVSTDDHNHGSRPCFVIFARHVRLSTIKSFKTKNTLRRVKIQFTALIGHQSDARNHNSDAE
jgi:hypothetical protein